MDLKNRKNFFIPYLFCGIVLETFFALSYYISQNTANNISLFVQELNATSATESFLAFSNNALRQMLIEPNDPVAMMKSRDFMPIAINKMFELTNEIQKQHSLNLLNHDSLYNNAYMNVFTDNLCDHLN